eukprot:TRINITY_DN7244_c0_g2_i2.p1 TRINITY_DN7244_c0_g2~~TRINITY_DN7244_c0_g2_i2.p1  ORF type:complete len:623 (+),score=183.94 TRINITY_DN7244_c0_g2_i2:162-2030(+)
MGNSNGTPKVRDLVGDKTPGESLDLKKKEIRKLPVQLFPLILNVKRLDLSNNKLKELQADFTTLTALEELRMRHNEFTNVPEIVKALKTLKLLDIGANSLKGFPTEVVQALPLLQSLNVDRSGITSLPQDLSVLSNIRHLSLAKNQLDSLPDLRPLHDLVILDLKGNKITNVNSLEYLTSLVMLNLSGNNISELPSLRNLTNLQHLDLSNNKLTKVPEELIELVPLEAHPKYKNGGEGSSDIASSSDVNIRLGKGKLVELNIKDNKAILTISEELNNLRDPFVLHTSVPNEILPKMYLGGLDSANNMAMLEHHKITHVLLAIGDSDPCFPLHFQYHVIGDAKDDPRYDLSAHFDECINFIEQGRNAGGILVHCRAGVSRSATLTIAYLMYSRGMSYHEAFNHVHDRRPQVLPNSGFREQLMKFACYVKHMKGGRGPASDSIPANSAPQSSQASQPVASSSSSSSSNKIEEPKEKSIPEEKIEIVEKVPEKAPEPEKVPEKAAEPEKVPEKVVEEEKPVEKVAEPERQPEPEVKHEEKPDSESESSESEKEEEKPAEKQASEKDSESESEKEEAPVDEAQKETEKESEVEKHESTTVKSEPIEETKTSTISISDESPSAVEQE